tara:strand:- start:452 stop:835 length:384 start_codon:yes stop_codon:yes gene_type:complete
MITSEDNEKIVKIMGKMHEAMEEIALYWGHVAEMTVSQTMPSQHMQEGLSRVKIWKTISDSAIRVEWKPRLLTETQMYSIAHERASSPSSQTKLHLIQQMFDGYEKEDIEKLKASIERQKKRRERHH